MADITPEVSEGYKHGSGCTISLKDYSFSVKDRDGNGMCTILKNINFVAKPGELVAILGPSGCGKTTLLNSIARRTNGTEVGEVHYNGRDMSRTELLNEDLLAYVMSKDRHCEFLTVKETLDFACQLKLPKASKEERANRVATLCLAMDLNPCLNTKIGGTFSKGLSTGEARRVSIAVELLDNPDILLLDEPTTGLDSTRAAQLIPVLRGLAQESNKNVIMTIHQPSAQVYANFDRIIIMSKGRIIVGGKADEAMAYVNSQFIAHGMPTYAKADNPADFMLDLVSAVVDGKEGYAEDSNDKRIRLTESQLDVWAEEYVQRSAGVLEVHDELAKNPMVLRGLKPSGCPRWWNAFGVLYCRISLNSIRNPMETVILTVANVFLTTWLGLIFWQSCGEPDPATWSSTVSYFNDLGGYIGGTEHPLNDAMAANWTPTAPDGSALPNATPLKELLTNKTLPVGETVKGFKYGTGRVPDMTEVDFVYPNVDYSFDDFPLQLPTSLGGMNDFLDCFKNSLSAIPGLGYGDLFVDSRYAHWDFEEIPTEILDKLEPEYKADIDNARETLKAVYRLISTGDFVYNHVPFDDLPTYDLYDEEGNLAPWISLKASGVQTKGSPTGVGIPYWLKTMACYGNELNALLGCMNFPALPNLRDHPLIGIIADVSCTKPQTTKSLHKHFEKELKRANVPPFVPVHREQPANKPWYSQPSNGRRLASYDASHANTGKDFQAWIGDFMGAYKDCSHEVCDRVDDVLGDTVTDLGAHIIPILSELHIGGMMFFLTGFIQFASFDAILTFQQERMLFNRETNNQMYPCSSYFIAKNLAALPFQYLHTTIGFTLLYFLAGIEANLFFHFYAMGVATIWAMYGFNYFFSACSKTLEMSIYCVPMMVITMMATCGFFIRESTFPQWISWIKWFSATRWSFHGFSLIYFPRGGEWAGIKNEVALGLYGVTTEKSETCFMALGLMGLFYRIVAFVGMKYLHRQVGLES